MASLLVVESPLQPENAELPIEVTLLGMVMDVSPLQYQNACAPIEVTLLGMVMDVRACLVSFQGKGGYDRVYIGKERRYGREKKVFK
jgi:hypothetical protein